MYISKRPFRISLFGGGTDYPGIFKNMDLNVLVDQLINIIR